jgi:hypothetical protein
MALINIKVVAVISLLAAPFLSNGQSPVKQQDTTKNQQKMENKIVIGKAFVPKASIEEFRKQNITSKFLKALPGFLKGEYYEMVDDSGNLHLVSITTWSNSESYNNAHRSLKEYYESIKFNPAAYRERLKIIFENGLYTMYDY